MDRKQVAGFFFTSTLKAAGGCLLSFVFSSDCGVTGGQPFCCGDKYHGQQANEVWRKSRILLTRTCCNANNIHHSLTSVSLSVWSVWTSAEQMLLCRGMSPRDKSLADSSDAKLARERGMRCGKEYLEWLDWAVTCWSNCRHKEGLLFMNSFSCLCEGREQRCSDTIFFFTSWYGATE